MECIRASIVAFIDLKSAFDIANKDVILDQLVEFGIKGHLVKWIKGYLSNRTSRVLFKGASSSTKDFQLGTPQGGVLSPFLFNILMHRLLSLLPDIPGTTVTCYAHDICIHSCSPADLQLFLDAFHNAASSCGLVISTEKSRIFTLRQPRSLPEFRLGDGTVPLCTQYLYLGAPVRITRSTPARQRTHHPIIQDLLTRLERRLTPLRWLTNNAAGVSIPAARTIYITFLRSVVDYLSPALCQLSKTAPQPLEKFQNKAMRLILGCPASTRVVNMQTELNLPPLVDRIYATVSVLGVKCLNSPQLAPLFADVLRTSLLPAAPLPLLRPGVRTLMSTISSTLRNLNIDVPVAEVDHGPPPWRIPRPEVFFTDTSKSASPLLQKQLALEHIANVTSSIPSAHRLYVDGSLQAD